MGRERGEAETREVILLGVPEGGGVEQRGAASRLASFTSVLAVSCSPLACRWFLIRTSSSFSEKLILDWATTLALCSRASDTSVPMSSGFPDTRSVSSAA